MESSFKRIGGDPALDFVNTVSWGVNHETVGDEKFSDYQSVVEWGRQAGVVSATDAGRLKTRARQNPAAAVRVLRRARALRHALRVVFLGVAAGERPSADQLRVVEDEVRKTPMQLGPCPAGGLDWQWDFTDGGALDGILWPVVWHAVDLLRSPDAIRRVKSCAGDTCGWVFIDESRRGNRRWCDMADCGNRAKVRRYYRRHRGD